VCDVRDLTYPPVVLAATTVFKALGIRFQMRGLEHIPRSGPAVLACNHISYVDFIFGGYAAHKSGRRVRYMAKKEIFDHPLAGPMMRSLHHISVDRSDGLTSYAEALRYLGDGEVVGMFPEATISYTYELKDFKTGAIRLAGEAGVPLIPVVLWGTQRMLPKGRERDFHRGQTLAITVGEPMHPTTQDSFGQTVELKTRMSTLLDETIRAYPERPPAAWWLPKSYGGSAPDASEVEQLYRDERRAKIAQLRKLREEGKA
jgi:1-acyl-sn-glycerol-3-phosphate acyltransferase